MHSVVAAEDFEPAKSIKKRKHVRLTNISNQRGDNDYSRIVKVVPSTLGMLVSHSELIERYNNILRALIHREIVSRLTYLCEHEERQNRLVESFATRTRLIP